MQGYCGYRSLTVFFQFVLTLLFIIFGLASAVLLIAHRGMSIELAQSLGLLGSCLALLLVTERLTTGRWFRWSRR